MDSSFQKLSEQKFLKQAIVNRLCLKIVGVQLQHRQHHLCITILIAGWLKEICLRKFCTQNFPPQSISPIVILKEGIFPAVLDGIVPTGILPAVLIGNLPTEISPQSKKEFSPQELSLEE